MAKSRERTIHEIEAWQLQAGTVFSWYKEDGQLASIFCFDGFDESGHIKFHSLFYEEITGVLKPRQKVVIGEIGTQLPVKQVKSAPWRGFKEKEVSNA